MKLLFLILLVLTDHFSQAQLRPLDDGRVDSLIKNHIENPPTNDYYIIAFSGDLVSTSLAPQVIREIKSVNKIRFSHEKILLIIKGRSILPSSQIVPYFQKLFDLSNEHLEYLDIVVDDELVNALYQNNFTGDAISLYVHQGKLFYKSDAKWYYIHNTPLPHNQIVVDSIHRMVLDLEGYELTMNSSMSRAMDGQLMFLRDKDKDVLMLNPKKGTLKMVLDSDDFNVPEIFCDFFVPDTSFECLTAKEQSHRLKQIKRLEFDIMTAGFDSANYYFSVTLQVVEQLRSKRKAFQDDGEKKVYNPNDYYVGTYGVFLKTDSDFKHPELFEIPLKEDKFYHMQYPNFDGGFLAWNDTLYFKNIFWPFYPVRRRILEKAVLQNNQVVSVGKGEVKFNRKEQVYDFSAMETKMTWYKGKLLYKPSLSKWYYEFYSKKPLAKLSAFGLKEVKPKVQNEVKKSGDGYYSDPYFVREIQPVFNGEYLACLYHFNNDKMFLEIKDSTFTTISTLDLSRYPQTPKVNNNGTTQIFQSVINNEYLYFFVVEGDEHVLYSYRLKQVYAPADK